MKKFFEEFKTFISRGNVMDMAIGVIVGGAFGAITSSLVGDVVTPLLAAVFNSPNTDALNITLRAATDGGEPIVLGLGTFIGAIINFLVIALVLFSVIKAMNKAKEMAEKLSKKKEEEEAAAEPPKPTTEELLGEILAELKKNK
ncbi:MAG: large conductance mechanosensitive channel protein MscL [Oscillospiraceae bacterium]|nr:large conductance mechanosensitive channel protein MscL [Oscillospiraceae bacterium]